MRGNHTPSDPGLNDRQLGDRDTRNTDGPDVRVHVLQLSSLIEHGLTTVVAKMTRYIWMLPCPLELKRSQFGREAMNDHLHHPRAAPFRLPCALRDLSIVLPAMSGERSFNFFCAGVVTVAHRMRLGGLGVLPIYVLSQTLSALLEMTAVYALLRSGTRRPHALQEVTGVEGGKVVVCQRRLRRTRHVIDY